MIPRRMRCPTCSRRFRPKPPPRGDHRRTRARPSGAPSGCARGARVLPARRRRDRRSRSRRAREVVPLWRTAGVRAGAAVVDERRPHLVQAQAAVARRPHRARDAVGLVPAPAVRHHSAAAPASRSVQRCVRAGRQTPRAAARARAVRDRPESPCCTAVTTGSRRGRLPSADLLRRVFFNELIASVA